MLGGGAINLGKLKYFLQICYANLTLPLLKRRELIQYFLITDIKLTYGNRILGSLWAVLDPLMMMGVYTYLVVIVFNRGGPQFPILLFSALLPWRWFTFAISGSAKSLVSKARLIQTVNFPRAALPLTRVLVGLVNYIWGLFALTPLLLIFHANLNINILWLPFLVFVQFILTVGLSFTLAIIGVYFRDINNILQFVLRLWFYLSPGLYDINSLSIYQNYQKYIVIYLIINPFATLFESYKNILVRGEPPNSYILITFLISIVVFLAGSCYFIKHEQNIVKEL
ncbi:MAG: ABC transporter permease [Gammaproteobacteria bacterium]|nr:ABC transporter permease [Gammaproteobacteria bacterium]